MEILPVLVRETGSSIRRGQWVGLGVILRDRVRVMDNLILLGNKGAKDKGLIPRDRWADLVRI